MPLPQLLLACALTVQPVAFTTVVDTLVDIGRHELYLEVHRGAAPLTIVFEAGGGATLGSWATVPESLADRTDATVVSYDRAGLGQSNLGAADLSPTDEIADLRRALDLIGAPERTILVGHSYGGMLALLHAELYPDAVAGLVLVDPMNPRFVAATGDFVQSTVPDIRDPRTDREKALARMIDGFDELVGKLRDIEPYLDVPMVVLTAGEAWWGQEEIDAAWRASHEAMAAAAPNREHVVVPGSGHDVPGEGRAVVVDQVLRLMEQVEGGRKVNGPERPPGLRLEGSVGAS